MGKAKGKSSKSLFAQERAASVKVKGVADQNKPPAKPVKKKSSRSTRARQLVEEFGLCPISMEPMRRPVLPSSGQAYDEINIVRFSAAGRKRCPVSGATMKFAQGGIVRTPDYSLRSVIQHQAKHAKVYIPPLDHEGLVADMRDAERCQDAVKAFVDDVYLGYLRSSELHTALDELKPEHGSSATPDRLPLYCQMVAECLACRMPAIVQAALLSIDGSAVCNGVLSDPDVLRECLGVGEDPDCRAKVLVLLEGVFDSPFSHKTALQVLSFGTESVPVQQSQTRIADGLLSGGYTLCTDGELEQLLNKALKVRAELHGCLSSGRTHTFWAAGLKALMKIRGFLDESNMDRLFWRRNRSCLAHLCSGQQEALLWHFARQPLALQYLMDHIAGAGPSTSSYDQHGLRRHVDAYGDDSELDDLWSDLQADYGDGEGFEQVSHDEAAMHGSNPDDYDEDDVMDDDEGYDDSDDESCSEPEDVLQPPSRRSAPAQGYGSSHRLSERVPNRTVLQDLQAYGGRPDAGDDDEWSSDIAVR